MNTSRYAESYRIQTYAEYLQSKRDKEKGAQTAKPWGEDGWVKSPYATSGSLGYLRYARVGGGGEHAVGGQLCAVFRSLRKRSISPVQAEQGMGEAPATDGWSHYSYPDSKKMKTDGEEPEGSSSLSWKCNRILSFFSSLSLVQEMTKQARSEAVESKTSEGWLKTA